MPKEQNVDFTNNQVSNNNKPKKENKKTFDEVKHFLETAKLLYPKLGGLLEDI